MAKINKQLLKRIKARSLGTTTSDKRPSFPWYFVWIIMVCVLLLGASLEILSRVEQGNKTKPVVFTTELRDKAGVKQVQCTFHVLHDAGYDFIFISGSTARDQLVALTGAYTMRTAHDRNIPLPRELFLAGHILLRNGPIASLTGVDKEYLVAKACAQKAEQLGLLK